MVTAGVPEKLFETITSAIAAFRIPVVITIVV